jgi:hypothetical protein
MDETQLTLNKSQLHAVNEKHVIESKQSLQHTQFKHELLDRNIITETSSVHKKSIELAQA